MGADIGVVRGARTMGIGETVALQPGNVMRSWFLSGGMQDQKY
jgi:hypothetical protein